MSYRMMVRLLLVVLAVLLSGSALCASPVECVDKLGPKLVGFLAKQFPKLHVPKLDELDKDGIRFDLDGGSDGCFAVAGGDFDGDKRKDAAVLLAPDGKGSPQLVVAVQRGESWRAYRLPTFCDAIEFCYVKPEKPGTYVRTEALDPPPTRPNERSTLTSRNTSVLSGRLESTGIVYVYVKGKWQYVWVSD